MGTFNEIASCDIKTNISMKFFFAEEDEDLFANYLDRTLGDSNIVYTINNTPSTITPTITVEVMWTNGKHDVDVRICADHDLSEEELTAIQEDDEFFNYLEREAIPQFIDWFNKQDFGINFPLSINDSFDYLKYNGENYYAEVYVSEDTGRYTCMTPRMAKLQLINDVEVYI